MNFPKSLDLSDLPHWVIFERDYEINGLWVAHILDLDLVTQGKTLSEAVDMAIDACLTHYSEFMIHGIAKHKAPQKYWDKLWELFDDFSSSSMENIFSIEDELEVIGTQLKIPHEALANFPRHEYFNPEKQLAPEGAIKRKNGIL